MERALAGQRVLVTGGSGFLGGSVVSELGRRGVTDVVIPRSSACDLTDPARARALFAEARPDLVIHLAAKVGGIGANRRYPGTFFRDNMAMGLNVLEEARRAGTPKVVIAGTICAYPKFAQVPFREDDLWSGYPEETNAPYGLAKKMLLVQSQAYRQQYGFNSVVVFPVNLYGPRDNFDLDSSHVIPALIRKIDSAQNTGQSEVVLWGDGTPTREFLYVADAAEGIVLAAERYNDSDPVNLGCGQEIAISDLAQQLATLMGYTGRFVYDTSRPNGQPRRALDVSRARERLGFVAATSFAEGLRRTVEYFRSHRAELGGDEPQTTQRKKEARP